MLIKELKITNNNGDLVQFGRYFRLSDDFDLSGLGASVNYTDSTIDGSNYQNTKLENRVFDIPFFIYGRNEPWWVEEQRNITFKVFNPKKNPLRLDFKTKVGEEYYLLANLEGAPLFGKISESADGYWQDVLVQFSANDPYIYRKDEEKVDIALWTGEFGFPLEFSDVVMGNRSPSLIVNVRNNGQESTGMKIRFKAVGSLENPSLVNVNTYESLKITTTMEAGDLIEVSTYKRQKKVSLFRGGVEMNIFNLLDLSSKFLQLDLGDNLFRYNADVGIDNLEVSITFTPRLLGV